MSVEELLSAGHDVRLGRRDANEVLQKLRARGAESEAANRLEERLADADEVVLARVEADELLDALKASGRRWISGTDAPRPEPPRREPAPEPEPQSGHRRRWFWRKG
jgi:3-hydroxyisobutyrate dehydrogenase-like beta-hydroxyacid dehydrogenase